MMIPDINDGGWRFLKDAGHVRRAAEEALDQLGCNKTIIDTYFAVPDPLGIGGECVEVWCMRLAEFEAEVRVCRPALDRDAHPEMVKRFVAVLEVFMPQSRRDHGM